MAKDFNILPNLVTLIPAFVRSLLSRLIEVETM